MSIIAQTIPATRWGEQEKAFAVELIGHLIYQRGTAKKYTQFIMPTLQTVLKTADEARQSTFRAVIAIEIFKEQRT